MAAGSAPDGEFDAVFAVQVLEQHALGGDHTKRT
jgi:hypothetical protein